MAVGKKTSDCSFGQKHNILIGTCTNNARVPKTITITICELGVRTCNEELLPG